MAHGICACTIKDRCWYICVMENMVCLTQQPRGAQRQIVGAIRKQGDFNDTVTLGLLRHVKPVCHRVGCVVSERIQQAARGKALVQFSAG